MGTPLKAGGRAVMGRTLAAPAMADDPDELPDDVSMLRFEPRSLPIAAFRPAWASEMATAAQPPVDPFRNSPPPLVKCCATPRIVLTPLQRGDLSSGLIDPRLVSALAAIAQRHTVVITALRSDHSPYTVDGQISNHSAGRAVDIGAVDDETCRGTRTGPRAGLVRELAAVEGPLRATELIYCWDPDGPSDPRGFARADHCDHIHWGMDP